MNCSQLCPSLEEGYEHDHDGLVLRKERVGLLRGMTGLARSRVSWVQILVMHQAVGE